MSKEIIFISDTAGLKLRENREKDEKPVSNKVFAKFSPFFVNDEIRGEKARKGYLLLDSEKDKELIEKIKKYPSFGRDFREADRLPLMFSGNSIVHGVLTSTSKENKISQSEIERQVKSDAVEKTRKYIALETELFKEDGTPRANASKAKLEEFRKLKEYLQE